MKQSSSDRVAALVREVADELRTSLPEGSRIYWFGSWVNGDATERSDIDLAIDAGRELDPLERAAAVESLDGIRTLYSFDLVDLHAIGDERRESLLEKAVEL
jgi:predicted nucleotidyltransferase